MRTVLSAFGLMVSACAGVPAMADCDALRNLQELGSVYARYEAAAPDARDEIRFDLDLLMRQLTRSGFDRLADHPDLQSEFPQLLDLADNVRMFSSRLRHAEEVSTIFKSERIAAGLATVDILYDRLHCGQSADEGPGPQNSAVEEPSETADSQAAADAVTNGRIGELLSTGLNNRIMAAVGAQERSLTFVILGGAMILGTAWWFFRRRARANTRHRCSVPADIRICGQSTRCLVLDISHGGARVSCRPALVPGTPVQIEVAGLAFGGTIQWNNKPFAGIAFNRAIGSRQLQTVVSASIEVSTATPPAQATAEEATA